MAMDKGICRRQIHCSYHSYCTSNLGLQIREWERVLNKFQTIALLPMGPKLKDFFPLLVYCWATFSIKTAPASPVLGWTPPAWRLKCHEGRNNEQNESHLQPTCSVLHSSLQLLHWDPIDCPDWTTNWDISYRTSRRVSRLTTTVA